MSNYTATMQRNEKKYCLNSKQHIQLIEAMFPFTEQDHYGNHTISNLYMDNDDFDSISKSIDKPIYKEKLRLRTYTTPSDEDQVFLEIKKKFAGVVYKRRVEMNLIDANAYLFEDVQPIEDSQTLHEFDWIKQSQKLHPKVFIAYDRCAFTDREHHSVRITIDSNIRWRSSEIGLEHGAHGKALAKDIHILEIKVKESFPLWLVRILDNLEIYPCSFSKYSQCYIDLLNRKEALRL